MNNLKLTTAEYLENFKGYWVYDCAVRAKDVFYFLLLEEMQDAANGNRRMLNYFPADEPGDRVGAMGLTGLNSQSSSLAYNRRIKQL